MPNVPAQLNEVQNAHLAYLEAGTATAEADVDKWVQMLQWGYSGDHPVNPTPFGTGEQYNMRRGGITFNFSATGSKGAIGKIRDAFNPGTNGMAPVQTWRTRYVTLESTSNEQHHKFTGFMKHFDWVRPRGPDDKLEITAQIQLCDANYFFDGTVAAFTSTRM